MRCEFHDAVIRWWENVETGFQVDELERGDEERCMADFSSQNEKQGDMVN